MRIYTRTGDDGTTGLCAGPRVAKDHPRIEACGTLDELNASIGVVRAESVAADIDQLLHRVQHELFTVGAGLAMPGLAEAGGQGVGATHVKALEQAIDHYNGQLPDLNAFILPGGTRAAATLHRARTVCRRAERRVVSLGVASEQAAEGLWALRYLNRLGDLLFVLPRVLNARAHVADECWRKGS